MRSSTKGHRLEKEEGKSEQQSNWRVRLKRSKLMVRTFFSILTLF